MLIESIAVRSHWARSAAKRSALALTLGCSLLAPAAWAQYSPQPNLFELRGRNLAVDYAASSIDGRALLRYRTDEVELTFSGDEIEVTELDGVTLVSVELDAGDEPRAAAALRKPEDGEDYDDKRDWDDKDKRDDKRDWDDKDKRDDKRDWDDKDAEALIFTLVIPPFELGTGREARMRTIGVFTTKLGADYDRDGDDGALAEFSARSLEGTARLVDF